MIHIEVVYALAEQQVVESLRFSHPVTIAQAIRASSILQRFPQLKPNETPVGVFGVRRPLEWVLADRDRVEIYRPLSMSPVEARRWRARIK